jgi:hypothetical protein
MKSTLLVAGAVGLAALALAGCQTNRADVAPNTVVAVKVPTPPSGSSDPAWANARALKLELTDGANFGGAGATGATLKALYTADTLHLLLQYADPTHSLRRGPYQKQSDGSWKKLVDPADKGGDDNLYYEDKFAFIWNIGNSIKNFDRSGCAALCHLGQDKPYGNKYTAGEGELGDIWHYKAARTGPFGLADDQYVDHTGYDPKTSPNAGRKNEHPAGDYTGLPLLGGKPQFMNRDGKAANAGGAYWIRKGDEVPFDHCGFMAGDVLDSYV